MADDSAASDRPKSYTVWLNYHTEGWHPEDCGSVKECFDYMRSVGHSGDYRITAPVTVEFIAKIGGDAL